MKKLRFIFALIIIIFALALFGCGKTEEDGYSSQSSNMAEDSAQNSTDDDTNDDENPQKKTDAQIICEALEGDGYSRNTQDEGIDCMVDYFNRLSSAGAVVPVEVLEEFYDKVEEYYIFEKSDGQRAAFAHLGEGGVEALILIYFLTPPGKEQIAFLEERGILYGDCMLIVGSQTILELIGE